MWIKRIGVKTYGIYTHWCKGPIWIGTKRECIREYRAIYASDLRTCEDEYRAGC